MSIEVKYRCDVCGSDFAPAQLIAVEFDSQNNLRVASNFTACERHYCRDCLIGLSEVAEATIKPRGNTELEKGW